jgi:hypothetical protein
LEFNFRVLGYARGAPFPEESRMFMQDIGNKGDTKLSGEDFSFGCWKVSFQPFEHCQSVGNWIFPRGSMERENRSLFHPLEIHSVSTVSVATGICASAREFQFQRILHDPGIRC